MSVITPDAVADHYRQAHERIAGLVDGLDDAQVLTVVPGTPEWCVHDLLAHLAAIPSDIMTGKLGGIPTPEETQEQVETRRGRGIPALLDEWRSALDPICEGARAGLVPAPLAIDVITHEQDLRGALGATPVPDDDAVSFAATGFSFGLGRRLAETELSPLRLHDPDSGFDVVAGKGEPVATVAAPVFELFRAMAGRRSATQVAAFGWDTDSAPYLDAFCVFGPLREQDLYDK